MKKENMWIPGASITAFEEFKNDGRLYVEFNELPVLNLDLRCNSKKGAIIIGPKGVGKTSLMRSFVQQDLNVSLGLEECVEVIHLKEEFFKNLKTIEQLPNALSEVLARYESSQFIIYAKVKDKSELEKILETIDMVYERFKRLCSISFLKFVFELCVESPKDANTVKDIAKNDYCVIDLKTNMDFERLLDVVETRTEELSKDFEVTYTKNVMFFYVVVADEVYSGNDEYNINNYIDVIEKAFIVSKMKGKTTLEKDCAMEVFSDTVKGIQKTAGEFMQSVAIHEVGHTLLFLLYKGDNTIRYATCFHGETPRGQVNCKEPEDINKDRQYYINCVAGCLAGRIAEKLIAGVPYNIGATSDLHRANNIIEDMLYKHGLSEVLENTVISGKENLSNGLKARLEQEKQKILESAKIVASNAILENAKFVKNLANKLCNEWVIPGEDIYREWSLYLKNRKEISEK